MEIPGDIPGGNMKKKIELARPGWKTEEDLDNGERQTIPVHCHPGDTNG
jgi:hypothetical protein